VAFSAKRLEFDRDDMPEKIVIATGLSFGDAFKFVLLGAALGAGATYTALQNRLSAASSTAPQDAVASGLSGGGAKNSPQSVVARLTSLSGRLVRVASGVKGVAQFTGETLRPAVTEAVREGRKTALEVQAELQRDLESAKENAKEQ
jgi:hypothetical protein